MRTWRVVSRWPVSRLHEVLLCGGTGGIGQPVGLALANRGYAISFTWCTDRVRAEQSAQSFLAAGAPAVEMIRCHFNSATSVRELLDRCEVSESSRRRLVYCVGTGSSRALLESDRELRSRLLQVNCGAFVDLMATRSFETGVAVSSVGSEIGIPGYGAIGMSKAALEAAVRQLAIECGPPFKVHCVRAGYVDTPAGKYYSSRFGCSDEIRAPGLVSSLNHVVDCIVGLIDGSSIADSGSVIAC